MKNIFNWTFGGFFRALGRVLCYLVIGILISLILSKIDVKIPHFLPIMRVNASELSPSSDEWLTTWCSDRLCDYTIGGSTYSTGYKTRNTSYTNSNHYFLTTIRVRNQFNSSNYLQIGTQYVFQYKFSFNPLLFNYFDINDWVYKLSVVNTNSVSSDIDINDFSCNVTKNNSSNYEFYLTCFYTPKQTLKQVLFNIELPFGNSYYRELFDTYYSPFTFQNNNLVNYKTSSIQYSNGVNDSINIQTTVIQNSTNVINDTINQSFQDLNNFLSNDDTSTESNSASDFFHNFNLSIEGPLSQIVLLPINLIDTIIVDYNDSATHNDLCTTFVGKQVCIPSGDILWKRSGCHDNSPFGCPNYSQFKSFFQLLVGGLISWRLLRRLANTIEKGLDPQNTRIGVMKL